MSNSIDDASQKGQFRKPPTSGTGFKEKFLVVVREKIWFPYGFDGAEQDKAKNGSVEQLLTQTMIEAK